MKRPVSISKPLADGVEPDTTVPIHRIHAKLRDRATSLRLHLQHYHMSVPHFKQRTAGLRLPKDIHQSYEDIVKGCSVCQKFNQAPQRSRTTGLRANCFGDLWFVDHVEISYKPVRRITLKAALVFIVLIISDAATNMMWAGVQKDFKQQCCTQMR